MCVGVDDGGCGDGRAGVGAAARPRGRASADGVARLDLTARVPGIDEARFRELADEAKANCPVSKVLRAEITLDATLQAGAAAGAA